MMRLLRRGTRRKASQIGVLPIETRGRRGKTQRKTRIWRLCTDLSGFSLVWGNPKR